MRYITIITILGAMLLSGCSGKKIKTLLITGEAEYIWMESSESVKSILTGTEMFKVKTLLTPPIIEEWAAFNPKFSDYELVVIDYSGTPWPEKTNEALKEYVNNGGGVLLFNPRNSILLPSPDSIKLSERVSFEVRTRNSDHPVTKGLPVKWMHPSDILASGITLGENIQVLATASLPGAGRARRPERPVLAAGQVGNGRIFISMLGIPDMEENQALHCAGFIVTLQRGAEWAATGNVTTEVPFDFPSAAGPVVRIGFTEMTEDEALEGLKNYEVGKSTICLTWFQSRLRKAQGNNELILAMELKMVELLNDQSASVEGKKLILKELSWMGSEACISAVKALQASPELKDEADFALSRLQ